MAKFYGNIGFSESKETEPGIWEETIIEKPYYGDITKNTGRYESSGGVNDNITIANGVSIIANPYAIQNFLHMRYIYWLGQKWKITNVEVVYPRLLLNIGGLYEE